MTPEQVRKRIDLVAILALALVVLAAYAPFVTGRHHTATVSQLAATFLLGAVYVAYVVFGSAGCERSRRALVPYVIGACVLVSVLIFISPARGFFFIIALPIVSQAVFELKWHAAAAVVLYLYAVSVAVIAWYYGRQVAIEVAFSYAAAFAFTIAFTLVGLTSVRAREQAEKLAAELEAANAQLRAHAAEAEQLATTQERNRLAREIHDGVGHYLTVIKVQLDAAAALLPAEPARAADSVAKAARLAGEALDDVRRSVGTLSADRPRPPLAEALRQLAGDSTPPAALHVAGRPRPLGAAAEHALYRAAQEGLTNVRKHASATAAELTLDFREPARVRLTVTDNGRGATVPDGAGDDGTGHGLRGLRERIALLGGTITAGNRTEGGFVLCAEVPA